MNWGTPTLEQRNRALPAVENIILSIIIPTLLISRSQEEVQLWDPIGGWRPGHSWRVPVVWSGIVTGSVTFSGGGGKNVTGAVWAGEMFRPTWCWDATIVYCDQAVTRRKYATGHLAMAELFS